MKTSKVALSVVRIAVLLLGLGMVMPAGAQGQAETVTVAGWFHVIWGDGRPGTGIATESYFLTDDSGHTSPLRVDEETLRAAGGILALNQQRVIMEGDRLLAAPQGAGAAILHVQAIRRDDSAAASAAPAVSPQVSGAQPWITIPCKFADVPAESRDLAYFQGMYSSAYPGLDHYWREVSYDAINLTGSAAVGWHTLPQPKSYYMYDMDGDGQADEDLDRMANDCTGVADPDVYFPNYAGISLMFNDNFKFSRGGTQAMNLDGKYGWWRMTWLADWGYQDLSVVGHEMGHGFGLPHSSGAYGQTYDNVWDVMSDTWTNCVRGDYHGDPVYGCIPQHTIAYHKDSLGWIPEARRRTVVAGERVTITLEQLAQPGDGNTLIARIPIYSSSTNFYTVEARRLTGYDGHSPLPGEAVIIHEVNTGRHNSAYVVDADGNGNTGDDGAMWLPGETFTAMTGTISVTVERATATGFVVTIDNRSFPPTYYVAPSGTDDGNTCLDNAAPCATVQRAVDVAELKSEIRVATGTYTGVNTHGGLRQVVYINNKSVTIRGGYATTNWAASDPVARPTILDAGGQGRTLYIVNSRATLEGLIFRGGNAAGLADPFSGDKGGNIYEGLAVLTIRNCIISNGKADWGAGLYVRGGFINLEGSTIRSNEAVQGGGGLMLTYTYYDKAVLKGNVVVSNTAGGRGGGIFLDNGYSAPVQLTNNVITDNYASMEGSGLYIQQTTTHLAHTTVARNRGGDGTGVTTVYSTVVMTNTIVAAQTTGIAVFGGAVTLNGILWYRNTTDQGGTSSAVVSHAITGDPAFAADGYHLTDSSAAIDTGVDAGITTDMDRQARPGGAGYDLGADENYTFKFVYLPLVMRNP